MHFHLPKPLHGWREFIGEVGVIVLGVLIALGFEQLVSSAHDRISMNEVREHVRAEIERGVGIMAKRQKAERCIQQRLKDVAAYLDDDAKGGSAKRPTWIGAPWAPLIMRDRYAAAQSAGKLFLLPEDEQFQLSHYYTNFDDFNAAVTREFYAWAQLRSLATSGAPLDAADRERLRAAVQEARAADWIVRLDSAGSLDDARKQGIPIVLQGFDQQRNSVCLPIDTPYGRAAREAGGRGVPFPE